MKEKRSLNILVLITFIAALALPLINTVGVGSLYTICSSDIAVPQTVSMLLNLLYTAINVLASYAVAACVGYSIAEKRSRLAVILIAALSLLPVYFAVACVDSSFYGNSFVSLPYIMFNLFNCGVELLRLGIVILAAFIFCKNVRRVCAVCPTVMFLWVTAFNVYETASLIINIGAPENIADVLELAKPHITAIIYYIFGLLLTRLLVWIFERGKESKNETNCTQSNS